MNNSYNFTSASTNEMSIACDLVLIPDASQAALAAECSRRLAEQGSIFTLDNEHLYAHASLYMFQMSPTNQSTCISALEKLAAQQNIQELDQKGYFCQNYGFGKGYTEVTFGRNPVVAQLQQAVLDVFNPLRAGMPESDKRKMTDATGLKLENLQQYGYPSIGKLFRPHITLTKFPAEVEPDLTVLPDPRSFTGIFTKLGLFEMGDLGTCIRKIAEFDL